MDFFDDDTWATTKNLQDHTWQEWKQIRKEFESDYAHAYDELKEKLAGVKIKDDILRDFYVCHAWMPSYSKEANLKCLTRTYKFLEQFSRGFAEMLNYCPEFSNWLYSDRENLLSTIEALVEWSLKDRMFKEDDGLTGVYTTKDGMCCAR